jgi:hypothetical protein
MQEVREMNFKQIWALLDVYYTDRETKARARDNNIAKYKDKAFPVVDVGRIDI